MTKFLPLSIIFMKTMYTNMKGSTKKASDVAIASKDTITLLRHFSNLSITSKPKDTKK